MQVKSCRLTLQSFLNLQTMYNEQSLREICLALAVRSLERKAIGAHEIFEKTSQLADEFYDYVTKSNKPKQPENIQKGNNQD